MGLSIERIEILLLIAAVVSMLARKLRLPYTVGLVIAGIAVALSPAPLETPLTKSLVFYTLLPPLIFEASLYISWPEMRKDLPVLLTLATIGVLLSAALTTVGMHYLANWDWSAALLFGVLIAATDPVSVIATFKELGVEGRLRLLVEAESLLNDGTVAVFFGVALAAMSGAAPSAPGILLNFVTVSVGGLLCGALVGGVALLMVGRTDDHLVEITFAMVAAYGSFLLAEHFHFSGVLATLTAGIFMGNVTVLGSLTEQGQETLKSFWEYVGFTANSLIFLLIGMHLARQSFALAWKASVLAILLVLMGRALSVYGCCALFFRSSQRVSLAHQHILVWGGLRGALALALVLGLPYDMPQRTALITVSFAVVAFSVIGQGLTLIPLLNRLGVERHPRSHG